MVCRMPARVSLFAFVTFAVFATSVPDAWGQGKNKSANDKNVTYKWTDEKGVTHYGDRLPPQYSQQESSVLNNQGVEVRKLTAPLSPAELAAQERLREEELRKKEHDSFLLTTYTSVKDIESLRDTRLDQIDGQRRAAEQYVESLGARLGTLQARAMRFKPYSPTANAKRMPDDLAEDLIRTLNEMRSQRTALTAKETEQATLRAQFEADITRYRELHIPR